MVENVPSKLEALSSNRSIKKKKKKLSYEISLDVHQQMNG
jgi:hypothetical protein